MKYQDAQSITRFLNLRDDGKLEYQGREIDTISISEWEQWLNEEKDPDKQSFFQMMIRRAKKTEAGKHG